MVRRNLYKAFVLAAGRSAGGFLHSSPFFLSVWRRSRRTGRNTRHHWALACRTGRINRRPSAWHIVPAPCHALPRNMVSHTVAAFNGWMCGAARARASVPACPIAPACPCHVQTRGIVPRLCRRIVCQSPWPSRTLRARPCAVFRRNAGTKCDRALASTSRTSDTCRGRGARR